MENTDPLQTFIKATESMKKAFDEYNQEYSDGLNDLNAKLIDEISIPFAASIPEEPPKPDPLIESKIRITMIEGGEYTSSLTMKKSQIYQFCNAMSDQLSDSKGNLVLRGSVDNVNDFCIIPGSKIKFIEFRVFKEINEG